MATLASSCRLIFLFLFLFLFRSCHCSKPTISHSREPFALSKPVVACIKGELYSLVQPLTVARLKEEEKIEKKTTCQKQEVTIRVRRLEWSYLMANSSKLGVKGDIERGSKVVLHEISSLLKLRYEWAVAIDGLLWVEYNAHKQASMKSKAVIRDTEKEEEEEKGKEGCLPRGDVLISHNGGVGGMPGMDILRAPRSLVSQNNEFFLMMQGDCNLVLYSTVEGLPLWNSGSRGQGTQCSLHLLHDATLAIYDGATEHRIWNSSSSSSSCSSIFIVIVQNDGNVVVYDLLSGLPLWATGTNQ